MDGKIVGRQRRLASLATCCLILLAADAAGSGIYQWRDADGRLHFGDRPPQTTATEDLSQRYDYSLPFSVVIDGSGYSVPPPLRDKLSMSVVKIFSIYQQALGMEYSDSAEFRIMIYGSEGEFRDYQRRVAPVLENAAGFYNSASNQITTWAIPNEQALIKLIIHECSHAISARNDHAIPSWLNEGLAEYFENLQVHGLSADIPLNRHWLQTLHQRRISEQPGHLGATINAPYKQWYAANGPDNLSYATSWSLVWFLMDSAEGRKLINRLLTTPHPNTDFSRELIEQQWSGGFSALEQSWRHWLKNAQGKHRY
ncbi:MAG: DUF4124 domain-containing protein [Alcanivoracaceae bacterium]|nr:DUF4124 domain-containing protein [Alcanivoracaceae bacterium]